MKKIIILITFFAANSFASDIISWSCSTQAGLLDADKFEARLQKDKNGYSAYITVKTGDSNNGESWSLRDETCR